MLGLAGTNLNMGDRSVNRLVSGLLVLAVAVLLTASLSAEDKKEKKAKAGAKGPHAGAFSFPKKITLDDKQKEQLEALKKEYGPRLAEVDKKRSALLTPERVKAAKEARNKVTDEAKGKELSKEDKKELGKKANRAYNEALKLTTDEQKQLGAINKERAALMKEINAKKLALLTDDQKAALKPKPKPKKNTTKDR